MKAHDFLDASPELKYQPRLWIVPLPGQKRDVGSRAYFQRPGDFDLHEHLARSFGIIANQIAEKVKSWISITNGTEPHVFCPAGTKMPYTLR